MKNHNFVKALMVITLAAVLGIGATAFAGPGMGYGRWGNAPEGTGYGPMGPGYGMRPGAMGYGPERGRGFQCYGYLGDMSQEDIKKLEEKRSAFWEDTKNLRTDLYEKRLALRSEMAKQNPDSQMVATLQKEISELRAQLDQKRIGHQLEVKKINPNIDRGYAGRGPKGYGAGFRGSCWR